MLMSGLGIAAQHLQNTFLLWISKTIAPHYTIIALDHTHCIIHGTTTPFFTHLYSVYLKQLQQPLSITQQTLMEQLDWVRVGPSTQSHWKYNRTAVCFITPCIQPSSPTGN